MTEAKLMPAPDISSEVLHNVEEEGAKDTPALVLARSEWVEKFLSMLHLEGVTWWTWRPAPSSRVVWRIPRYLCARARWNWMLWPGHAYHQTDQNKPFKEHYWPIMCEHILNMLATGAITPSKNPWSNAVILVYKNNGSLHYCIDFCWLNTDKGLSHCLGSKLSNTWLDPVLSTIDFNSGFWQVKMDEELKQYTACSIRNYGFCEFKWMPFGLCNTPTTFQQLM